MVLDTWGGMASPGLAAGKSYYFHKIAMLFLQEAKSMGVQREKIA